MRKDVVVNVIGAGLAGSEAAYQLIKRGIKVRLYEMRGVKNTEAHVTSNFAELICSNSLRAKAVTNAVGLLKEEMNQMDSLIMKAAYATEVEAGGALAVDRVLFSEYVTNYLKNSELVEFVNEEVTKIVKEDGLFVVNDQYKAKVVINATGVMGDIVNELVNDKTFDIMPRKGQYYVFDHFKRPFVSHTLFMVPSDKGKGVLITPTTSGNYLVGPSAN